MSLAAFLSGSLPRANPRPRPYEPPLVAGSHTADEVDEFTRAIDAAAPLLRPDDFDWRVVQKWQSFPSQCTSRERDELRAIGTWFKDHHLHDPPAVLYRGVGVHGWDAGWSRLRARGVAAYAEGFRSWAEYSEGIEVFCTTDEFALFTWKHPPDDLVILDGRSVNAWLYDERPDLAEALGEACHGHVGFDGGEYLAEAPRLAVVSRRRVPAQPQDDRSHFEVVVKAH